MYKFYMVFSFLKRRHRDQIMLTLDYVSASVSQKYRRHWLTWKGDSLLEFWSTLNKDSIDIAGRSSFMSWPTRTLITKWQHQRLIKFLCRNLRRDKEDDGVKEDLSDQLGCHSGMLGWVSAFVSCKSPIGDSPSRGQENSKSQSLAVCLHICSFIWSKGSSLLSGMHRARGPLRGLAHRSRGSLQS